MSQVCKGVGQGLENLQHFGLFISLWTSSTLLPPSPPSTRMFTRRLLPPQPRRANQHNIHLSIVGWVPGGPAPCQGKLWGTGAGRA